ncbi:phage major capsid protein [Pseudonocardia sp. RS11V-5]|uniref:phage major capsid protein n=1 Tax=Pseudonocardia terrae TaxID=2905831 RepID=UPI001E33F457|nr:phage major capsid protein [Pseudonocardia terrae]MCE3555450.1 phage major capsid protein [Pseudonocardia terrae]
MEDRVETRLIERAAKTARMHVKAIESITDRAEKEGRDLTSAEEQRAQRHLEEAKAATEQIKALKADQSMRAQIADLGGGLGLIDGSASPGRRTEGELPSYAKRKASAWAQDTAERITKVQTAHGIKALVAGSVDVRAPADDTVTFPQYPLRVLDLLTDRKAMSGNVFSYLRQTVRDLNAAPVPDGAVKPTSVVTTTEIEDRCRVVAHISEPVVERLLADYDDLEDFLRSELEFGVLQALEAQLVSGDGQGEDFTGLLHTSGTIAQPYVTSPWVSIRKGLTALEVMGESPTAIVVHPADAEAFDLAREGTEGGWLLASAPGNITTGLPLVRSIAVPPGTALLGDWRQTRLYVREDAKVDVDRSGDLFTTNQVRLRVEGRWGLAVRRPSAFAAVDLTTA